MTYRVEAWSRPLDTTAVIVANVPYVALSWSDELGRAGRGTVVVREAWDRLSEVAAGDKETLYRVFQSGVTDPVFSFIGKRVPTDIGDQDHGLVKISGPGVLAELERATVEAYDYPTNPTVDRDWLFGAGSTIAGLRNASFEDSEEVSGVPLNDLGTDFEDQTLQGWQAIPSGGDFNANDTGPTITSAEAEAGTYSLTWDPDVRHSGVRKKYTVQGGESYTWTIKLKSATTGKRFTAGVQLPSGASATHTNAFVYNGYGLAELGNVARNAAGNGLPGGSTDGTWQTFTVSATFGSGEDTYDVWVIVQYDHHDGSDGPVAYVDSVTVTGPGLGLLPWKKSNTSVSVFEQDSVTGVTDGTYSAEVTTTSVTTGIEQLIEGMTAGRTYSFEADVYHTAGSNQDFIIRFLRAEGRSVIGTATTTSVATATSTRLANTVRVDVEDVLVQVLKSTTGTFWVDNTDLYDGLQKASYGDIWGQLHTDLSSDHTAEAGALVLDALGYVDVSSFTATLDSAGNAWSPATVAFRARRGKKLSQVWADGSRLGYEHRMVDTVSGGLSLEIYNAHNWTTRTGGIGTNQVGAGVKEIKYQAGVIAGELVKIPGQGNRVRVEGDGGIWEVRRDATSITANDTQMVAIGDTTLLDSDTVGTAADTELAERVTPTEGLRVTLSPLDNDALPAPYVDLNPGDTYPINLVGTFVGSKRIMGMQVIVGDFGVAEKVTLDFDQRVFASDPKRAQAEAVRLLLEKYAALEDLPDLSGPAAEVIPFDGPIEVTFLVAASDARSDIRDLADFVCDGTDDQSEILNAINQIGDISAARGRVVLSEGTFVCESNGTSPALETSQANLTVEGVGRGTRVKINAGTSPTSGNAGFKFTGAGVHVRDIYFIADENDGNLHDYLIEVPTSGTISDCTLQLIKLVT